ncbi:MAG: hypothetical protein AB7H80_12775 [Candidatus Kapaibacterium sp.]
MEARRTIGMRKGVGSRVTGLLSLLSLCFPWPLFAQSADTLHIWPHCWGELQGMWGCALPDIWYQLPKEVTDSIFHLSEQPIIDELDRLGNSITDEPINDYHLYALNSAASPNGNRSSVQLGLRVAACGSPLYNKKIAEKAYTLALPLVREIKRRRRAAIVLIPAESSSRGRQIVRVNKDQDGHIFYASVAETPMQSHVEEWLAGHPFQEFCEQMYVTSFSPVFLLPENEKDVFEDSNSFWFSELTAEEVPEKKKSEEQYCSVWEKYPADIEDPPNWIMSNDSNALWLQQFLHSNSLTRERLLKASTILGEVFNRQSQHVQDSLLSTMNLPLLDEAGVEFNYTFFVEALAEELTGKEVDYDNLLRITLQNSDARLFRNDPPPIERMLPLIPQLIENYLQTPHTFYIIADQSEIVVVVGLREAGRSPHVLQGKTLREAVEGMTEGDRSHLIQAVRDENCLVTPVTIASEKKN